MLTSFHWLTSAALRLSTPTALEFPLAPLLSGLHCVLILLIWRGDGWLQRRRWRQEKSWKWPPWICLFFLFCQTLEKKTLNLFNHSKGTEERAQLSDFGEGKNMETNGHWQSNMAAGSEQLETIFARKCPSLPSLGDVRWKEEKLKMLKPVHVAR